MDPDLRSFLAGLAAHDRQAPLSEAKMLAIDDPDSVLVVKEGPDIVACGVVAFHTQQDGTTRASVETAVTPSMRFVDFEERVLGATLSLVPSGVGSSVWSRRRSLDDALGALGMEPARSLAEMTVDLPLDLSPEHRFTVEVRPFREGDEDTLIGINRAAFGEHPEAGSLDTGELSVLMAEPWFDPDGVLFHEADGSVVAFCWTKVHDDEGNTEGEIYRIGVDADNRGGGLGAGMVVAGFEYLAGQGIRRGFLWVDEANTPAVKLYRNLGMTTRSRNREFIRSGRGAGS